MEYLKREGHVWIREGQLAPFGVRRARHGSLILPCITWTDEGYFTARFTTRGIRDEHQVVAISHDHDEAVQLCLP